MRSHVFRHVWFIAWKIAGLASHLLTHRMGVILSPSPDPLTSFGMVYQASIAKGNNTADLCCMIESRNNQDGNLSITTSLSTETILKKDFAAVEQVNSSSALGKDCSQHMSQRLQFGKKVFSADWRVSWKKYEWLF